MLKITAYVRSSSTGWIPWTSSTGSRPAAQLIGRSTGAEVTFKATTGDDIVVFTTGPTPLRRTYMVISRSTASSRVEG